MEIVARWLLIHAMYHLGVSGSAMARVYDRKAGATPRPVNARR